MKMKKILVLILALAMIVSYTPTTTINALSVTPAQQASQTDDENISDEELTKDVAFLEDGSMEFEMGGFESELQLVAEDAWRPGEEGTIH